MTKKLHLIGKVHSSQGLRGSVFVTLKTPDPSWLKKWKTLYLSASDQEKENYTEYSIVSKKEHSKQGKLGWVLNLKEIDDKTASDLLEKQFVWIPESFLVSKEGEKIFLREIENFLVVDKERGEVGPIVSFSSNGAQDLIQIKTETGIYDVPLVQPFIEKIDYDTKKIFMDIPQGLLEEL
ncbi:ribosome maturation factor RimM [bacterium]|nr:ribosome maturation factor RimM [bacterium]